MYQYKATHAIAHKTHRGVRPQSVNRDARIVGRVSRTMAHGNVLRLNVGSATEIVMSRSPLSLRRRMISRVQICEPITIRRGCILVLEEIFFVWMDAKD
jgi:hypothetical protein